VFGFVCDFELQQTVCAQEERMWIVACVDDRDNSDKQGKSLCRVLVLSFDRQLAKQNKNEFKFLILSSELTNFGKGSWHRPNQDIFFNSFLFFVLQSVCQKIT